MHLLVQQLPAGLLVELIQTRGVLGSRRQVKERIELESELKGVPFADVLLHYGEGGVEPTEKRIYIC